MAAEETTSTGTPDREHQVERGGSTPGPMTPPTSSLSGAGTGAGTPDVHSASIKIRRAKDVYEAYAGHEEEPTKLEVFGWCFYGLCSYFIHTVLIPIVFPLIISQIASKWPEHGVMVPTEWKMMNKGVACGHKEALLVWFEQYCRYDRLTNRTISVHNTKYSPLEWTSISWGIGLIVAAPALGLLSIPLDRGPHQPVLALAATVVGAIFCLPAGFFRTVWIFPPYIAAIIAAATVPAAYHTRHLGLMVSAFTSAPLGKAQFPVRHATSGWLSIAATAAGSLGAAIISAFTYHMLKEDSELMSLWIVSIFSGLKWMLGSLHFVTSNRSFSAVTPPISRAFHTFSIIHFPHALGSVVSVFLSSLSTMTIFTGTVLFLVGERCFKPKSLLCLWLAYFLFPLISLPILHPIQHLLKVNAVKMQIFGFFITALVSGFGFAFRDESWATHQVLIFAAMQGTATGTLDAFGRVLLLDCAPRGKEGAFSSWFVWAKAVGSCVGFAVASAVPANVTVAFGVSFCTAVAAVVVLIFGNVSDFGGAVHAGHVRDGESGNSGLDRERGSPVNGVDSGDVKQPMQVTP